jgi:signal transduction histidine kinase
MLLYVGGGGVTKVEKKAGGAARPRPPVSARFMVGILFGVSLAAALSLLLLVETAMDRYYQGERSLFARVLRLSAPATGLSGYSFLAVRAFNAAFLRGPDAPAERAFLEDLSRRVDPLGVALRVGDRLIYSSPTLPQKDFALLPPFGDESPSASDASAKTSGILVQQLDFRRSDGTPASVFIFRTPGSLTRSYSYSRRIVLVAALLLLAADASVGLWFIMRLTAPLREMEAAALAISSGDLETPVRSLHGIAELGRVFDALETMRDRISGLLKRREEEEASRRELIANLSHDLRTPLAAIRGYVDGLRDGIADTPEKRERYIAVLGQKIRDLDRMIGQIFLLSTLDAREVPSETKRVDLRQFMSDSLEGLELSMSADEISFEVEGLAGRPLHAMIDPLQMRRVVENVADNARKHGGRKPVRMNISLRELDHGRAELRFADDGKGIPEAERERVFDRFRRLDPSRPGGGLGLGLAIARRIVDAQGGSIRAECEPGGGAAIVIELPVEGPAG